MTDIIFTCRDYVVARKPYGILSQAPAHEYENGKNMPALLAAALRIPVKTVYTVHRLDRTTEGVMVYALNRRAAAEISKAITDGGFRKTYTAYITADDELPQSGEMRDFIFFDRQRDKSFVTGNRAGAKEAVLNYTLGEPFRMGRDKITPAEVHLMTGRTHQIRVQFASRKSPLIGDRKYGSKVDFRGASLFSSSLSFPWSGEVVSYSCPAGTPDII